MKTGILGLHHHRRLEFHHLNNLVLVLHLSFEFFVHFAPLFIVFAFDKSQCSTVQAMGFRVHLCIGLL